MNICKNYIDGSWQDSIGNETFLERNPADLDDVIGQFSSSKKEDVENAITAASNALSLWSQISAQDRSEYLKKVLDQLRSERASLAEIITRENGKTINESLIEIDSAIYEMEFQIHQGLRLYGNAIPTHRKSAMAFTMKVPLGVVAIITPWNFPLNVACRKMTPALMAGNTVILKPASLTSLIAVKFIELFDKAKIPRGVVNLIMGNGHLLGEVLTKSNYVNGLSFTGSTEVGKIIQKNSAYNLMPTQLELGGKNPAVVLADADLEEASNAIILGAFACSGQWCTSTSRVIVEKSVEHELIEILRSKACKIKLGNGSSKDTSMGPVCGTKQLETIKKYIDIGKQEGAKLVIGGEQITTEECKNGCFISPTIFSSVTENMRIATEEIFGPVLSVIAVDNFEEAVRISNNVQYGLSSSIFTKDFSKAIRFINQTKVGLTHVNMPTAYKEPILPFGGVKMSGAGLPEAGTVGIDFFTKHKVAYLQY